MAEYELIEVGDIAGVEAPAEGWKFHNDKGWIHGNPSFAYVSEKAGATVYFSETKNRRTLIQGFGGDRAKEDLYESYATFEKAKDKATYYLNAQYSNKAWKAANKKERSQPVDVEIGDIFYNSWGYEQTNIDFYQVIAKTAATVTLRQIGSECVEVTSWASENCKPVKDAFLESKKEIKKRVQNYSGKAYIAFEHGSSGKWAGESLYRSWYA